MIIFSFIGIVMVAYVFISLIFQLGVALLEVFIEQNIYENDKIKKIEKDIEDMKNPIKCKSCNYQSKN